MRDFPPLDFAAMREAMVVSQLRPNAVDDPRVILAFARVPREAFVAASEQPAAYMDRAVPVGDGAMLNPPLTLARLFDAARLTPGERLLIVSAAPGYALAIAGELDVYAEAVAPGEDVPEGPFDAILIDGAGEVLPDLSAHLTARGRIVGGVIDGGVARLARGTTGRLVPFADAEMIHLAAYAAKREFAF